MKVHIENVLSRHNDGSESAVLFIVRADTEPRGRYDVADYATAEDAYNAADDRARELCQAHRCGEPQEYDTYERRPSC